MGATLFAVFVALGSSGGWRRAAIGRALAVAGDPLAARVRPVAWGMTAALVATLVANVFYLTMTFYYFYVFAVLAAAVPVVCDGRATGARLKRRRPDDVVPARAGRRRGRVRTRRGRAPAGSRRRGRGGLAGVVPALGLAYGHGIPGDNLASAVASCSCCRSSSPRTRGLRAERGGADLVHAHWLPSALRRSTHEALRPPALGHDVELALRAAR